ncbi:hypothetical protein PGT21_013345 [Puccinia graminis f. sp. tritici]|uniref:Uncharacterized protein n=2 Tax=Puccinia graminis f. sp. tritici TaxID=56615 RepID=A0A5B0R0W7_PUCGR|nr:hypothetical protein PGT21_013345 [Puccinia graminis f. sp. tritici]
MLFGEEFQSLARLVGIFEEPDHPQTCQDRLVQALKTLGRKSKRDHKRALKRSLRREANYIDRSKLRNNVRWMFKTKHLPLLHEQIKQLSVCLDPTSMPLDPNPRFQAGLTVLSEINDSVDQIVASISRIWESPKPGDSQENVEDLTVLRCHRMGSKYLNNVMIGLSGILESYRGCFAVFTIREDGTVNIGNSYRTPLIPSDVDAELCGIKRFIEWLGRSNISVLQDEWHSIIIEYESLLCDIMIFVNSPEVEDDPEELMLREQAEGLIPLVKLSRLFINKLRLTNSQPRLTSHMDFGHLEALRCVAETMSSELYVIFDALYESRPHTKKLIDAMIALDAAFKDITAIFIDHFDSLDPNSDPEAYQSHRRWIQLWLSQFNVAIENFIWLSHDHIIEDITTGSEYEDY